jgi:hypothetical protein
MIMKSQKKNDSDRISSKEGEINAPLEEEKKVGGFKERIKKIDKDGKFWSERVI